MASNTMTTIGCTILKVNPGRLGEDRLLYPLSLRRLGSKTTSQNRLKVYRNRKRKMPKKLTLRNFLDELVCLSEINVTMTIKPREQRRLIKLLESVLLKDKP